ncbi:MAG TPA: NADH:flavin oxidoreductase/NADH oxidase [Rhodanobacteraceae bacterium]|nr:NADH:flavin oxidoreductase/NADH oxidase [Rhodanobacteraceae bacterium]
MLLDPIKLGALALRNRIVVSPMCQYSSPDGVPTDWHLVHLGSRAVGGAGLVFTEASSVSPEGRISPDDAGIWNDAQAKAWSRIVRFIRGQGAAAGVQLAHAGRKASTDAPWRGGGPLDKAHGGWTPVAPSAVPFDEGYPLPTALDAAGIAKVIADFRAAAQRARDAGFEVIEIHGAHGYLIHQFLSPLSNTRTDEYGGSLENRARLLREIIAAVRETWPAPMPLWVRLSATDWAEGGWNIDECVQLARVLRDDGIDVIDVSSGGTVAHSKIPTGPGYQVPFAARIRREAGIHTATVGLITDALEAEDILRRGDADLIEMAREFLRDPYFPRRAAKELDANVRVPEQYARAW